MKLKYVQNFIAITATIAAIGTTSTAARGGSLTSSLEMGIFDETTAVEFELIETRGRNQSVFGVLDVEKNQFTSLLEETKGWDDTPGEEGQEKIDWLGTCGNTVIDCYASYTFEANKQYKIGLWEGDSLISLFQAIEDSYTYTTTSDIYSGEAEYKTVSDFGAVFLGMEEMPVADNTVRISDYQDFVVKTSVERKTIPEPQTWAGLGAIAASLALIRRKTDKISGN